MTWILILWIKTGAVLGTGAAGTAIHSVVFQDRAACVEAMNTVHKQDGEISAVCLPSASSEVSK